MTDRDAIVEFVKAWDALPQGNYSPRVIDAWLNSDELIRTVRRLRDIAAEEKQK